MENTTYEAVMIGVSVFVFIIALSAGVILMTSILNMVEYANQTAIKGMNGTIAESIGEVETRIYTGEQVLAYYNKNSQKYLLTIKLSKDGDEKKLSNVINQKSDYIKKQFELQYKGNIEGKDAYIFVSIDG